VLLDGEISGDNVAGSFARRVAPNPSGNAKDTSRLTRHRAKALVTCRDQPMGGKWAEFMVRFSRLVSKISIPSQIANTL
jgi:hypothetical protein